MIARPHPLLALVVAAACNRDAAPPTATGSTMTTSSADRLVLVVDTTQPIEIGYGFQWRTAIRKVIQGALPDAEVWMSVHGADVYEGHFQCCAAEQGIEVTLRRIPQRGAALSGFVAKDGTTWEIESVKR